MSGFFQLASAVFTRIIFLVHGFISVYFVVQSEKDSKYWWLCTGLVLLILESFYTIIIRKGKEYKYFWPGSFLYMCTVLPAIWVAEMSILAEKRASGTDVCLLVETTKNKHYSSVYGVINIRTDSSTQAQKFSKLGLILVIIVGRWLLPRGSLTRDQLSALLLVYVANAADIMELFELFDINPSLWCRPGVAKAVLATYTWCFMQFTLVFTATARTVPDEAKKKMSEAMFKTQENTETRPYTAKYKGREKKLPRYIRKMIKQKQVERLEKFEEQINQVYGSPVEAPKPKRQKGRKHGRYSMHETVKDVVTVQRKIKIEEEIIEEVIKEKEKLRLHGDLYSILTIMLMQDGPFLCVRLIMTYSYKVDDETHMFFTGKNAMALIVLTYRLIVLLYEGKDENVDDEDEDEFTRRPKPFAISYDRESADSRQSGGRRKMATSPV